MDFYDVLAQVIELLQREGRVSYRVLKRQFSLDDDFVEALKEELIYSKRLAVDEDSRVLVWADEARETAASNLPPARSEQESAIQKERFANSAAPTPDPSTPDAERRQLTVMFCDLAGSTQLSGQLDPEDLRDVIRAYQETAAGVIQRYEGHIAQYLGDGLLVYFGWPQAHEDDALRALHAGLGIVEAMTTTLNPLLEQDKGVELAVRIGIHTGPVVVGEMGGGRRHENLATGETVNIAARLEGLAASNTVVISDATYRLVQGYFACDDLGPHTLKGVATPMRTYRVHQATEVQGRLDVAMSRGLTPLVGREQEVGLLIERWAQVRDAQGQVILLSGEAGIGKSRLVQVLKEHLAEEPHVLLECRSSPYYHNSALYPITDLLHRVLQWYQEDTPEQRLEKLERALSQYRLSLDEAVPLFAPLMSIQLPEGRYPPLKWTPQRQRQKTLEAIVVMLLEQAERQPVLFILEDLHWTDPSTLEVLDLQIEHTPTASMMVLLTCRPEFEPPWELRPHLTPITLSRFTRSQVENMAERVTGGKRLPAEIVQHIVEKTDGVPLFVEELTKAILESGVLRDTHDQYELAGPVASLAIPTTLQDSLMARLDRLDTAKSAAQLGATIGREFSYELLHAVSPVDEKTLQGDLGRLVSAELVYQRGVGSQATYVFKHALIQDTAYQSLLRSTRQKIHQRIAQVLVEQFAETAETQPELLAHHYTEAGTHEQAVVYWQRAGDRAVARSSHTEAIGHFRMGLEVLTLLPNTPARDEYELKLQRALGASLIATKGYAAPEVEPPYTRARALCQLVGNTRQVFPVLFGLWGFHNVRVELQIARELAEQLLARAELEQDSTLLLQGRRTLGDTLYWLGEFRLALDHLEQGIALYDPQQHRDQALVYGQDPGQGLLVYAALVLWMLGYPEQARQRSEEAITITQGLSHPFSLAHALAVGTQVYIFRREWHTVQEWAEMLIALATEQGFAQWLAGGRRYQGMVWAIQGPRREEGIAQVLDIGLRGLGRGWVLAHLAQAYGMVGQADDEGLPLLAEGQAWIDKTGVRYYEAELYRVKGELLLSQSPDNQTEAETCFQQALSVARHQHA